MKISTVAGWGDARFPLRSERHPFQISSPRVVNRTFVSARVTPGRPASIVELVPGVAVLVRDIEGEQILFTRGRSWYRSHIDEFMDATAPVPACTA